MNIGAFLKTTGGKVATIGGGAVAAVGITAAVLMQGEGFRSISVEQVAGTVSIVGEQNNGQAYEGEHLYSGDDVTVGDASELTMCMDNDKYVYADANTHFILEASAASEDSRIKIYLDAGSELNELQSKLNPNDTYEVDTPNSTMSVRGTKFRVTVYTAADGMTYTLTEVSEGTVKARLKTKDGTYNGVEQDFTVGQSALIRGNEDFSEFVTSDLIDTSNLDMEDMDESEFLLLAYGELPEGGMDRLIELLEKGDLLEEDTVKEEETEEVPTPTVTPTPEVSPAAGEDIDLDAAEVTPTPSVMDTMFDAWVVGTDPETGGYILKDGTIFDPVYYAQHNPDVVARFGNDPKALLYHWLTQGRDEKRPPSERAAREQEEAFKNFAKMLDDAYAEEQRLKQLAEAEAENTSGDSTGGSTVTKASVNAGGRVTVGNTVIGSFVNNTLVVDPNTQAASITLPMTISQNNNDYQINSVKDIDWTGAGHVTNNFSVSDGSHTVSIAYDNNSSTRTYSVDGTQYSDNQLTDFQTRIQNL